MESTSFLEIYRRLQVYIKPLWKYFALAILGMVFYSFGNAGFAAVMKPLLDEGLFVQTTEASTWKLSLLIISVFLIRGIGNYLSTYYMDYVGNTMIKHLRADMFEHLLYLPATYFDQQAKGKILTKLMHNANQALLLITTSLSVLLRDSLTIIVLLSWLLYLNWIMTFVFILLVVPIIITVRIFGKRFRKVSFRLQEIVAMMSGNIQQAVESHVEVKVATAQEQEYKNFEVSNQQYLRQEMRMSKAKALSVPIIMFLAGLGVVAIVHISQIDWIAQSISIGTFVSFIFGVTLLFRPMRGLATLQSHFEQGRAGAISVFELLDESPEKRGGKALEHPLTGSISFQNVSFRYSPERNFALQDINLNIQAGETIALVGRSGSGKSTLVNLIMRLYNPSEGVIEIDGHPIEELNAHELRQQISYVAQQTILGQGSIRENIAYGNKADDDAIIEAATKAQIIDLIHSLPEGLDTKVGNDLFSGGQSQRISIARALLRNTPLLIFDEITSAQDYDTEKELREAFMQIEKQRTVLIITHRFSMIGFTDRIILLEEGKIIEQGTHDELLKAGGAYSRLYRESIL